MSTQDSRARFEAEAEAYGFDIRRHECLAPEPWAEYRDDNTGHRWGGWSARDEEVAALEAQVKELKERQSCSNS